MIKKNSEILDQLMSLHKNGIPEGSKIGHTNFDEQLTFVKGGCTDITGYPFYGKSLFLKEIIMGLTINDNWRHCVYMPDDGSDTDVISNLLHKMTGKTFEKGYPNTITEKEIAKFTKGNAIAMVQAKQGLAAASTKNDLKEKEKELLNRA